MHEAPSVALSGSVARWLSLCLASFLASALLAAEEPKADEFVGLLDEGRTYRRVNGQPIRGKDVADFIIAQEWDKELAAFAERELVNREMEKSKVTVSDEEIDEEIKLRALAFAQQQKVDPAMLSPEVLSQKLGMPLSAFRDLYRTQLGLKKVLVKEGKIKADARVHTPRVRAALQERLESTIKAEKVVTDPSKLPPDVGLKIGDRPYPRKTIRGFIIERLGPLLRRELAKALEAITLTRLVAKELHSRGVDGLTEDDRIMHLSYMAALLETEQGVPDGRAALFAQLKAGGMSVSQAMKDPAFTLDASLTCMVRRGIGEKEVRKEFEDYPRTYRLREKRLAHLFLRVRDPLGRGYAPDWEMPDHPEVNAFASAERERRFAEVREDLEKLLPLARNDFATAVREHSEDEETRRKDEPGLLGRLSAKSVPTDPLDAAVLKEALKLKPGQLSKPLRSAYGWHLVRCLADQQTQFKEARSRVYLNLLKKRRGDLLRKIREGANVEDLF